MPTYFHHIEPAELLAQAVADAQHNDLEDVFVLMGCPPSELLVTPYSARAGLLGAAVGRGFFPHELRLRIPMPEALEPEIDVWSDGTVPVWREGILTEPKYFSFFQDFPHAAYNPNYRHQWRAHELLHGAVGFFFRPDMTRFEFYVASRLNELLPVVHWYGLDEAFRHRCDRHRDQTYLREFCSECERLAFLPLTPEARDVARAQRFIELADTHLRAELQACRQEIETGRAVSSPIAHIDASSDAIGYLRSHWPRCTAWSFGYWVERFLTPEIDYQDTCDGLYAKVDSTYQTLLQGRIEADVARFRALHQRRRLQDLAYRILLVLEGLPESVSTNVESALEPTFEALENAIAHLATATGETPVRVDAELQKHLPRHAELVLSTGFEATPLAIEQVVEGLQTALPVTAEYLGAKLSTVASVFVENPVFSTSARLDERFAEFLPDADEDATKLAEFEVWANAATSPDDEAETFGAVPEDIVPVPGSLRLNTTLRRRRFAPYVMQHVFGMQAGSDVVTIQMRGQNRFAVVDEAVDAVLEAVACGRTTELDPYGVDVMYGLIEEGFVVWLPCPRSA